MILLFMSAPAFAEDRGSLASVDRAVGQIEAMFPQLEGTVVSLEGGEFLVDLKQGDPVHPGDRLKLIRYGEEILHPATGKKLGRKETELGEVEIVQIGKNFSRAKTLDKSVTPQVGDGVRPPFRKIVFLVAPLESKTAKDIDRNRLVSALEKRLQENPRFEVPGLDLGVWMLEAGVDKEALFRQENLDRLREKVKADFVLLPSVREVKDKMALSFELRSTVDGQVKDKAEVLAEQIPLAPKPAKTPREQSLQTDFEGRKGVLEFVEKQEFPFEIVDFDVGDLNGDGSQDFAIADRHRILIYRHEDGKFKKISQVATSKTANYFLSIDVGDVNSNGRDEIFVTNKYGDGLKSFVLEANPKQKRFDKIWDNVTLYFRIIRPFGAKPKLLAQTPGFRDPFTGGIKTIQYKGDRYVEGPELPVPSIYGMQFILYGLTQTSLTSSKTNETIILDKDYHLRVYSPSGRLLVKSDDYYGHDPRLIDVGVKEEIGGIVKQGEPVNYRGRLQFVENGGRKFLLIPRNYVAGGGLLSKLTLVNDSSLVLLGITREGFEKVFETRKQKGYIAAFQTTVHPKTRERKVHVVTVQEGGLAGKTISSIFTYNWQNN
ncbi:MAG: VCBS repeat-containing protein [Nitrospinae bacterium]|nr:VCBS repeat-containing protein [Nitrospinota bacterium]